MPQNCAILKSSATCREKVSIKLRTCKPDSRPLRMLQESLRELTRVNTSRSTVDTILGRALEAGADDFAESVTILAEQGLTYSVVLGSRRQYRPADFVTSAIAPLKPAGLEVRIAN